MEKQAENNSVLFKRREGQMNDQERLNKLFDFSLFDALSHRRVRRFGLGYKIDDKITPYESKKQPIPLSDLETAILCWAGDGITGVALGEQQLVSNVMSSWNGKSHPCPCNDQHTVLSYINDDGVFFYRPPDASKVVEIDTVEDRDKILKIFKENTIKQQAGRPQFPKQAWLSSNLWFANSPGGTFFTPIIDMTGEYINFCLFAFQHEGYFIMDQFNGRPAGVQKWIDKGYFDKGFSLPLLMFESFVYNVVIAMAHYKIQNIALACEAIGVGNFTYSGFTPLILLGGTPLCTGLGATFITGKDGMPNPVAIKGQISALCPPNVKNMDEAVDALLNERWGENGIFTEGFKGKTPFKDWPSIAKNIPRPTAETIQITKDFCNYVYDQYGRFPAYFDSLQVPVGATVHHIDLDFYDQYYPKEVLTDAHRNHLKDWHE